MNASIAVCAIACASSIAQLLEDADLLEQHRRSRGGRRNRGLCGRPGRACTARRCSTMKAPAALMTLVLKLPHSPLSPVTMITSVRLSGRARAPSSSGWIDGSTRDGDARQHALHLHGVRPRAHDPLLRAAQLRRGDHLHRLGDLLRVLDRADRGAGGRSVTAWLRRYADRRRLSARGEVASGEFLDGARRAPPSADRRAASSRRCRANTCGWRVSMKLIELGFERAHVGDRRRCRGSRWCRRR